MRIEIHCPHCGEGEIVPESAIGKRAQCNNCVSFFTVGPPNARTIEKARAALKERAANQAKLDDLPDGQHRCHKCGTATKIGSSYLLPTYQCQNCKSTVAIRNAKPLIFDDGKKTDASKLLPDLSPFERRLLFGGCGAAVLIGVVLSLYLFLGQRASADKNAVPSGQDGVATSKTHPSDAMVSGVASLTGNGAGYAVEDSKVSTPDFRELRVRLSHKLSKAELADLGQRIKSIFPSDCERTFIYYYLPGTVIGKDLCWATTHFDPGIDVSINYGGEPADEQRLRSLPVNRDTTTVGEWLDADAPGSICRLKIYYQNGEPILESMFADGDSSTRRLSANGGRFTDMPYTSSSGDYMLVDSAGNLQFRDNAGLIRTANRL